MKLYIKAFLITCLTFASIGLSDYVYANDESAGWMDIAVGSTFSLGLKKDGTLWAWGRSNRSGVFGNGNKGSENPMVPVQVSGLKDVRYIAAGSDHALAIDRNGSVWSWGSNSGGQLGIGAKTILEPGYDFKVVEDNDKDTPNKVNGINNAIIVAGDWGNSYAVTKDGNFWSWGLSPTIIEENSDIISVSSGYSGQLIAAKKDGTVWSMSGGAERIIGLRDVTAVAAAAGEYYALKKDGTVWKFGFSGFGTLNGKGLDNEFAPKIVEGIKDVVSIQATAGGPLYLKKDGTVWASGDNLGGQLGIGSYEDSDQPVQVKGLHKIVKIAAHGTGFRSMALREDGTLFSWGNGYTGDGTKWYRTKPVWIKSSDKEVFREMLVDVVLNGEKLVFEQEPMLVKGKTMVPMRKIFESMGAAIKWDDKSKTISAIKGTTTIQLTVNSDKASINGKTIRLDAVPFIQNGITFVPTRFISEALGADVNWRDDTKTVLVTSK